MEAHAEIARYVAPHSVELASIVDALLDDHDLHPLNVTTSLLDSRRRERTIELIVELAQARLMKRYDGDLDAFLGANPGTGVLFSVAPTEANFRSSGESRKQAYVNAAKSKDRVRQVGPNPTEGQIRQVKEYGSRLQEKVLPAVRIEVEGIARLVAGELGTQVSVSARAKRGLDILDKVVRMTAGREGVAPRPRPGYQVGDVIDAVGARITVADMATLEAMYRRICSYFGLGDGGRILEIENMYAQPKAKAPEYRVIPMVISIEVDDEPYTFELQLTTQRASIAADINHNTIYKPYVEVSPRERKAVLRAMREAAALDQMETRCGDE